MYTTDKAISDYRNWLEKQLGLQLFYRKHKISNNELKIAEIEKEIYPQAKKIIAKCYYPNIEIKLNIEFK